MFTTKTRLIADDHSKNNNISFMFFIFNFD